MLKQEAAEQAALVQWVRLAYPKIMIVASANGGSRNMLEAKNLKRTGVTAGWPDLFIACARGKYHGMFIEMKSKKGRLTKLQKDCLEYLNEQNYYAVVCYGFEPAKEMIRHYLHYNAN